MRVLRSLRARLVVAFTVGALVFMTVAGVLFTLQLRRSLRSSLDTGLDSRAAALTVDIRVDGHPDLPPPVLPTEAERTLTVVTDATGAVVGTLTRALPSIVTSPPSVQSRISTRIDGLRLRLLVVPVTRSDGVWHIIVGADEEPAEEAREHVDDAVQIAGVLLLLGALVGASMLTTSALRPVERMRAEADQLGSSDQERRLKVEGPAELSRLARTFNALLDRLHEASDRQRTFIADASHELRTPLAVLRTELELADRPDRSREDLLDSLGHARKEVEHLSALADDLLFLARADSDQPLVHRVAGDLRSVVDDAVRAHRAEAGERGVALEVDGPASLPADLDPQAVRRAVDNLLSNALRHTPAGGSVTVTVAGPATVAVADTGPGFPPAFVPIAFERFRRAEASRTGSAGGAGLGLAIVAEVVAAHGGEVTAAERPGGGALVTLRLASHPSHTH